MAVWQYPEFVSNGSIENQIGDYANTAVTSANSAASNLASITPDSIATLFNEIDTLVGFSLDDLISPDTITLTLPTAPTAPTTNTVPLNDTPPTAPTLTMNQVATDVILQGIITDLETALTGWLTGGTGLPVAVEADLWNRARDRITLESGASYQKTLSSLSARGFSRPQGADLIVLEEFSFEAIAQQSDINREIAIEQARLAQTNVHKAVDALISFHSALITAKASDESNKVRGYEAAYEGWATKIRAYNETNKTIADIFKSEVDAYAAQGSLQGERARVLIAQLEAVNNANETLARIALEKLQLAKDYMVAKVGAKTEGYKAAGMIYGQIGASAINGMNISYSFGQSYSKSESHSFDG